MPFKRDRSPYYYIWKRRLPGYGDSGKISTGVTSKRVARDMERLLEDLAQRALLDSSWYDLLDAVCHDRRISLPDLLRAKNSKNEERLAALKRSLHDPPLSNAIAVYVAAGRVKRETAYGLQQLGHYAAKEIGSDVRLGDLSASSITLLCNACLNDPKPDKKMRKRNSVRRYMLRSTSLLLRYHFGKVERDRIFADVHFPAEDDTREVDLLPKEIEDLLGACAAFGYHELAIVVRLALQTSADRGVLLAGKAHHGRECRGLLVRDLRIFHVHADGTYRGEVYLSDGKTKDRDRTVPLTDVLCRELLVLSKGKAPDDPVFSLSYRQLDYLWMRVRKAAGLGYVRFKDLRAQVSQFGEEAGIPQTILTKTMGHSDEAMTRRYQKRAAAMSAEQAAAIERAMFPDAEKPFTDARKSA